MAETSVVRVMTNRNITEIREIARGFSEIASKAPTPARPNQDKWLVEKSDTGKTCKSISFEFFNAFMTDNRDETESDTLVCFMEEGYHSGFHDHIEEKYDTESCLVVSGQIQYIFQKGRIIELIAGESVNINAKEVHSLYACKDAKVIISFKPKS